MIEFFFLFSTFALGEPQADPDAFDLEMRKERLPWIWKTPTRQTLPTVHASNWGRGPLDTFILARLETAGLRPASPAEPHVWLRRVHFAVTGLPPSPDLVNAFQSDLSPAARERVVDRILASPHVGERWARHWMDSVRYAESRGHEVDFRIPNAYQYRDYLIRALNADVAYDRFVTEHIAGDLVAEPRMESPEGWNESVLGTGWAFFGEEMEAPVDLRQDDCERTDNKLNVLSKLFLGLTIACARCHDHKFDAISQKDYYALAGFIASSSYRQVRFDSTEHNRSIADKLEQLQTEWSPRITEAAVASYRSRAGQLAGVVMAVRDHITGRRASTNLEPATLDAWLQALCQASVNVDHPLHVLANFATDFSEEDPVTFRKRLGELVGRWREKHAAAMLPSNARVIVDYGDPSRQLWLTDGPGFGYGPVGLGDVALSGDPGRPVARIFHYGCARKDPTWDVLELASGAEEESSVIPASRRAGRVIRTPTFVVESGALNYLVRGRVNVFACIESHIMVQAPLHQWLFKRGGDDNGGLSWITHDLRQYRGLRMHLEFAPEGTTEVEVLRVVESDGPLPLPPSPWGQLYETLTSQGVSSLEDLAGAYQAAFVDSLNVLLSTTTAKHQDHLGLADWLVNHDDLLPKNRGLAHDELAGLAAAFAEQRNSLVTSIRRRSRTAIAWLDGNGLDLRVLDRGDHRSPGEVAQRGLPEAFGYTAIASPNQSGRLELARQLVDSRNPLVGRVIVNRVWHHLLGRGIVASVDNLGYLGERPTHPALLDHLAATFTTDDRWSMKKLIRRIVLSTTYSMSSRPEDEHAETIDPTNRLWHRMNVRRLEGEAIRDTVLAVSGRLDRRFFGSPIPVHLTSFIVGRGRPTSGPLDGNGRRSIYASVRRNFLSTLLRTFDMPVPFSGSGRRTVTNVPAQPLAMTNDRFISQQAGLWAASVLKYWPSEPAEARIEKMYHRAFARKPTTGEIAACKETLADIARVRNSDTNHVDVWADLCDALFETNEFIYVR